MGVRSIPDRYRMFWNGGNDGNPRADHDSVDVDCFLLWRQRRTGGRKRPRESKDFDKTNEIVGKSKEHKQKRCSIIKADNMFLWRNAYDKKLFEK